MVKTLTCGEGGMVITNDEAAEAVKAAEPKKSPIKVGGAMRVNYVHKSGLAIASIPMEYLLF